MVVKSSVASPTAGPVDVVVLRAQYLDALERFRAYAARLAEHSGGAESLPVHLLEAERLTLQEFVRVRAALVEALAPVEAQIDAGILSDARDETIRRSIAKRNDGNARSAASKQRHDRSRRRAWLIAVADATGRGDEPRRIDDGSADVAS